MFVLSGARPHMSFAQEVFCRRCRRRACRCRLPLNFHVFLEAVFCDKRCTTLRPFSAYMDLQYNFPESLPYISYRLAIRRYFHGRAFGMGEWFEEDAYSVFEEGRVRFGLDGLLLPGHQGHIAV